MVPVLPLLLSALLLSKRSALLLRPTVQVLLFIGPVLLQSTVLGVMGLVLLLHSAALVLLLIGSTLLLPSGAWLLLLIWTVLLHSTVLVLLLNKSVLLLHSAELVLLPALPALVVLLLLLSVGIIQG